MSNNIDSILARSNEILMRVRRQIAESPSYLSELVHPPSNPVAVPFAPTAISLDETAHSIQTAGDQPPEADETGRPSTNDEEAQRRIREFFTQRMSALNMQINSQTSISDMPAAPQTTPAEEHGEENEVHEEEEEEVSDVFKDRKPILDEPFVITGKETTTLIPEEPVMSTADIPHPIQYEGDIDNVNFIEQDIAVDGLWVPDLPLCKPENAKRMEYRLLWDDPERQKFFGADLTMKIDTPPICQIPPPFPIEPFDHYGRGIVTFTPASVWGLEDIDIKREFKIEVQDVQFLVHPLSCNEDIITKKIVQLYKSYIREQEFSKVDYYKEKITALREAWKKAKRDDDIDQEKKYLEDLHNCRELQEMEENNLLMIREDLIKSLNSLRETRANSIIVSPIVLRWKRRNFNNDEKADQQEKFDKELRRRIQEERRRLELDEKEPNDAEIKREILERRHNLGLREPGESIWKPVLEYNQEVTPLEECPPQEKERRELIGHAQVFLKYFVNRQETHKSATSNIDPNFIATFSDTKKWVSNIIPHTIKVEIWESGYFKGNRLVASVILPITVGTLPEFKPYEFTSDLQDSQGHLVMGTMSARCFIVPETTGEIFVNCPDGQNNKTKRQLAQDPSAFMSVPDLLQRAEKHDPNDYYMAAILSQVADQREPDRVDRKKIKLDSLLEYSTFASLVPTSIGMQLQQHMERLRLQDEERRRQLKKKKEEKIPTDFLSQVRQTDVVQNAKLSNELQLDDVVREAPMPNVPKIFKWIKQLMSMYRPLKPIRNPSIRSKLTQTYHEAIIRIMNGFNFPQRTEMSTGPITASSLIYSSMPSLTSDSGASSDFICRVTFNGKSKTTERSGGTDPKWNGRFQFKLTDNDDARPDKSELAKKTFRIDIFDKVVLDDRRDDRETNTRIEQVEKRMIGYVEISLQALWVKEQIQGTYPVITPPFQLGYTKPDKPTVLVVFAKLNPELEDDDVSNKFDSAESKDVTERADAWENKVKETIKGTKEKRRILVMISPTGGKSILPCRMVKKQAPPEIFERKQQLVRFVSMIPNKSDAEVFDTIKSVWCTSQEFLKINAGDDEEHALLLCNFFKDIGLDAYIVLGYDYVNGKTTFVITKEGANRVTLYDPMSGLSWSSKNRDCLLYSVGMVFNDENVWANIQSESVPYRVDWNFQNNRKWFPLFPAGTRLPPFDSPQEDILVYKMVDEVQARQIERELINRITDSVETWRGHKTTLWNPQFAEKIRFSLELCERAAMTDPNANFQQIIDDFRLNYSNYRMTGGPFCLPFTSYDDIVEEVKTREGWNTDSNRVYFALGVFVVPYPNSLYAVWVMLATLESTNYSDQPL